MLIIDLTVLAIGEIDQASPKLLLSLLDAFCEDLA
jgi:hypothetical protein